MGSLDSPMLRPLSVSRLDHEGRALAVLEDPSGIAEEPVVIPLEGFLRVVRFFDGTSSLSEIQARVRLESGATIPTADLEKLVHDLDAAMILDGPTFQSFRGEYARSTVRPAAFAGRSYAGQASELIAQLDRFFRHDGGAGVPDRAGLAKGQGLRGVVSPHIDFGRGGPVYTWAYKELVEQSDAEVFVILGVAHQRCTHRFALTGKDFDTPLGRVSTDREYVDTLATLAGSHLFDDELVHHKEHSIEFQAVFLKYLLGGHREFQIVPILVGSFHDLMEAGTDPIEDDDVSRFVEALRKAEKQSGKKVAYIGGIDLSHVGPEFGDPTLVDPGLLQDVRKFDHSMLEHAAGNDPRRWFKTAADVGNRWRVCGLAATYTMLHAMGPARGKLLRYDQAVDERRTCCVSFASLSYHASEQT